MAILTSITGTKAVLAKLHKQYGIIDARIIYGLISGGKFLKAQSQKMVPVQTGHLRGSSFIRNVGGKGFLADIVVGYEAEYAVFVHENVNAAHGKAFNIKH